jgi:hypothetical protein
MPESTRKGLLIVNTGNGKGKTTAALGTILQWIREFCHRVTERTEKNQLKLRDSVADFEGFAVVLHYPLFTLNTEIWDSLVSFREIVPLV